MAYQSRDATSGAVYIPLIGMPYNTNLLERGEKSGVCCYFLPLRLKTRLTSAIMQLMVDAICDIIISVVINCVEAVKELQK